eukprot:6212639-Pleurochrysis_carterae.AAC.2
MTRYRNIETSYVGNHMHARSSKIKYQHACTGTTSTCTHTVQALAKYFRQQDARAEVALSLCRGVLSRARPTPPTYVPTGAAAAASVVRQPARLRSPPPAQGCPRHLVDPSLHRLSQKLGGTS